MIESLTAAEVANARAALERGKQKLLSMQAADGSWNGDEDDEPIATATQMCLDAYLGRLDERDAKDGARFLASRQRADGSFPGWPHATEASLSATGLCVAALHAAQKVTLAEPESLARAQRWLDANGGTDAVLERLWSASDQSAVYMAMVGLVDPRKLPDPELWFSLVSPVVRFMELKLNAGVIMGMMAMGFITRDLRAKQKKVPIDWLWAVHKLEAQQCRAYMEQFQNPDGNFDGNTIQSALYVAGLRAMGCSLRRGPVARGVLWLDAQKIRDAQGMHVRIFTCENWMTAFTLRALLRAGVPRTDARIDRGLRFLCSSQITTDMPLVDQRKPGATRRGGWAFQPSNPTMPDCDDTGSVLSAFGLALVRDDGPPLIDATFELVSRAVDRALPQLLDMQAPSGGWSAFVWNLGEKQPGPMFTKPIGIPRTIAEKVAFFLNPPVELMDPPAEGLTGRVLCGLGAVGYRAQAPAVGAAMRFLEHQRADNGAWWGRWLVNYLPETASVIQGLAAVRAELSSPWITGAVDWMISKQNDDGGWGETPASYTDPAMAGVGPSMPAVTAMVVSALLDAGRLDDATGARAIVRGVRYLLRTQEPDGAWPNNGWLQTMIPPDQFYEYFGERYCRPVEALAQLVRMLDERLHPRSPESRLAPLVPPGPLPVPADRPSRSWQSTMLQQLRTHGDPVADEVITDVFRRGSAQALHDVMGTLVKSDDPLPVTLPAAAVAYFQQTEALPAWADSDSLAVAHDVFEQHGWVVALGLFTSALPQAYCAAKGARVLLQTQGMTRHTRRRILETAQFVFDVLNPGAFTSEGRAVRAIQKVRLMHGAIRHLVLMKGEWDTPSWGVPINQEDLAGTLMTFSVVILDTFATVGIELSSRQQMAFLHLWNVVGHMLGVAPALLPHDVADGRALMNVIRDQQWQASAEGAQLCQALVQAMEEYLPGDLLDDLPESLIRHLAGDRCAALLSLKPSDWTARVLDAADDVDRFLAPFSNRTSEGERLLRHLSTTMMEALVLAQREGKEAQFRIPTELIRRWSLSD